MKKNILPVFLVLTALGCQPADDNWQIIQKPSPKPAEPAKPAESPLEKCNLRFEQEDSLKQVALKAAQMFEVCHLNENEIRFLIAQSSTKN